ncbi:MAG: hypothetical protein IJ521_01435 [Schwartzia sp.]|nr:hypothetical protein [Schwartzia sp. (in: firmicutes)]
MKKYYCGLDEYANRADALEACDVTELDTEGMIWNGEIYHDRDTGESWKPMQECEIDETGDIEYAETIGYRRSIA